MVPVDARELLAGLAAVEISTSCSVSIDTARRWKRRGRCPQGMQRLLELTLEGELGAVAAAFAGWRLDARHGELVSPEGWCFTPGEIRAIPFRYGQIRGLERQVRELVSTVEARADRRARLEALAAMANALAGAGRALEELRTGLTTSERDRLFELSRRRDPPAAPADERPGRRARRPRQ